MTPSKKAALTIALAGLGVSFAAFLLNAVIAPSRPNLGQMFGLGIVLGNVVNLVGCIQLARAKGRPWWYGLLGIFSCVGLAVLWFAIPDDPAATPRGN